MNYRINLLLLCSLFFVSTHMNATSTCSGTQVGQCGGLSYEDCLTTDYVYNENGYCSTEDSQDPDSCHKATYCSWDEGCGDGGPAVNCNAP